MEGKKHLFGQENPDTKHFDDHHLLKQFQGAPHKIQEIEIFGNDTSVVGVKATYRILGWNETVEGAKNVGHSDIVHHRHLKLKEDEYVTELSGRAGNVVDYLKITTNHGNTIDLGGPGGFDFKVQPPYGQHFATVRGGFGGDLHFLDFGVQPLPQAFGFQPFQPQEDQFFRGKRHADTREFNDQSVVSHHGGQHKIKTLRVFHDNNSIIGLQAEYFVYGENKVVHGGRHVGNQPVQREETIQLEDDEFITEIYGRHGDIFDFLGIRTNKGNNHEFGGSGGNPFEVKAPHGRHFAILKGGLGGHIHNLDFIVEPIFQKHREFPSDEFKRGKTHHDTVVFSDHGVLKNYPPSHKIWKLTVFHDEKAVHGLQANYFVFGPNVVVQGERHVGNQWNGGREDAIELAADEHISEIFGRHGDILDNFGFITNKGRKFDFGGSGGSPFEVKAPHGYQFGVVRGGLGGHIHFVDFGVQPVHQTAPKW